MSAQMLLEAIIRNPDDDLARLAYADALEEQGEECISGHVRRQVARPEVGCAYGAGTVCRLGVGLTYKVVRGGEVSLHRGFVKKLRTTMADWVEHGPPVARCNPIETVELIGYEPEAGLYPLGSSVWYRSNEPLKDRGGAVVGCAIWDFMYPGIRGDVWINGHETLAEALSVFSRGLILWARSVPEGVSFRAC